MNVDKNFIEEIIDPVKECVSQASNEVMKIYRSDNFEVIDKSDGSPLTKADKKANEVIIENLKKMIRVKANVVRAIPLPPISLGKGPVPICPPNKKVKDFFDKIGSTIQIKSEKLSINFWSMSGMMASYYNMLNIMSNWLVKKGIKRADAQKYITSLFLALSEDAVVNSKKNLSHLVKVSQTPKGLNEQGLKEMRKKGVFNSIEKTLSLIYKRLYK